MNLFAPGTVLNRRAELHSRYGGQQHGGISTPKDAPLIFLFAGEIGSPYGYCDEFRKDGRFDRVGPLLHPQAPGCPRCPGSGWRQLDPGAAVTRNSRYSTQVRAFLPCSAPQG